MALFRAGRYAARLAETAEEVRRCQRLRHLAFIEGRGLGARAEAIDRDEHDERCRHVMVEEEATGLLVCCFRILPLADGSQIASSYSARHYGLERLARYPGRMVEMGRFCIRPGWRDPNVVRVAWAGLMRFLDDTGTDFVFGCSSFQGVDAGAYADAFALLGDRHLAPARWLPGVKAPRVVRFGGAAASRRADARRAARLLPPLLRSYLLMGGWVSDHAVVDPELDTLHVFIAVEISRIPPARARLMRRGAVEQPAPQPASEPAEPPRAAVPA